ncbi:MAG TPA: tRNA lysidine(34) synthetase TilS [Puia sp.]|jgi:tRNA(Ile)-lysidine synthase|nr:tRNA lysidine(34) synthetase TilS [Puia sp.]
MVSLLQRFQEFIRKESLFQPNDRLFLAVSGGLDSVVLCELCFQSGFYFAIAHCNFQLRGEESERDEIFVRGLSQKYDKEFLVKKFDTQKYAVENNVSIQVAARELRYGWFHEIANSEWSMGNWKENLQSAMLHASFTFPYILTAHHLNDNIETLLMNFFKGTGIAGLHGIFPKRGQIIRPLLFAKKEELKKFAEQNNLQWVEDTSNETDKYSRNYFRQQIIPLIEKIYPGAINNLSGNISRFRDVESLYQQSIAQHKRNLLERKGNEIHIPVLKLKKSEPLNTIIYEVIKEYQFSSAQVGEVINLLESESGKYIQSSSHRIIKNRNWLIISSNDTQEMQHIIIDGPISGLQLPVGNLHVEMGSIINHKLQAPTNIAQLDADKIKFPLLLRKWKQGDYFYPLGMKKKKKLGRFFIDNKLSQTEKENVWVMEMERKIVWVLGLRIDERFKITPQTQEVLKIIFNKS